MRFVCLAVLGVMLFASGAEGQDVPFPIPPAPPDSAFVNVNVGFRALSQEFFQQSQFTLYEETGAFEAQHAIKGGPSFEASAGLRVAKDLSIGAAFTARSKHTRDVTVAALVPSPLFTNRYRSATGEAAGLVHAEQAIHVQALLRVPVTIEFDVTLFAGPTFFLLEDEIVERMTPTEGGATPTTVELSSIGVSQQRQRTTGFHAGLDLAYMFMRHAGAGAMLRYSRGTADLTMPAGSLGPAVEIRAGGLELAAGVRLRF